MALITARIGAFAGGFNFHKADQHIPQRNGKVRPSLERGKRRFAHRRQPLLLDPAQFRQILEQPHQRRAKLILRLAAYRWIGERCLGVSSIAGDYLL
jgi:hypothetical protein